MNAAAYDRIIVSGKIRFESIISFSMKQTAGAHATACLRGILAEEGSRALAGRIAGEAVTVADREIGRFPPVFEGIIGEALFSTENGLDIAELRLLAGSSLLDTKKKSRSYQNVQLTYGQIIEDVLSDFELGDSVISSEISGKEIGSPIIRYCETAWEFILRLASHYNLPVYSDIRNCAPRVYVGIPTLNEDAVFSEHIYSVGGGKEYYLAGGEETGLEMGDFLWYGVESAADYSLGCKAAFKGRSYQICGKSCEMDNGLLTYKYTLAGRKFCYTRRRHNPYFAGMSLLGNVLKTEKAYVRVKLDIDENQDVETACPWPWTPETGNLMYLMPKVGTRVSIYFGDDNEANGLALHCVRTNAPAAPPRGAALAPRPLPEAEPEPLSAPLPDDGSEDGFEWGYSPGHRSLTTEHGKRIFMYGNSVGLYTAGGVLRIRDDQGVTFNTPGTVNVIAAGEINIRSKNVATIKGVAVTDLAMGPYTNRVVPLTRSSRGPFREEVRLDAKALVHMDDSGGIGFIKTEVEKTLYRATVFRHCETINDDPEKGEFDAGKVWVNALAGMVVVIVIGAVTAGVGYAVAGVVGVSAGGCVALTLGGSVVLTGTMLVAGQVASDYQRGVASSLDEYLKAAILGSAIGIINGVSGLIPGVGTSLGATIGAAFVTGAGASVLEDLWNGSEIDWVKALKRGGVSALSAAIRDGVSTYICFAAGTPVHTSNGIVAIEDIRAGDMVYSENRETGEKGLKRVARTFVSRKDRLVHICVGGETIICTPGHPFYVMGNGWTDSSLLRHGDELLLQSGEAGIVEAIQFEDLDERVLVYNFEVEDWHAYYVGDSGMLVHNIAGCGDAVDDVITNNADDFAKGMGSRKSLDGYENTDLSSVGSNVHPNVPPWKPGDPATGIFKAGEQEIPLSSGQIGPGEYLKTLPGGSGTGINAQIPTHVEGHVAGIMRQTGIKEAELFINKPPCATGAMCRHNLNKILPPDSTLTVHFPDETGNIATWIFKSGVSGWTVVQ
ncbi:MAG: hypothetical protein LBH28_01220 [Oscillospiraceae bacterium]|nr:hypothetical protein [Oscillospiraceae bacterium]